LNLDFGVKKDRTFGTVSGVVQSVFADFV